MLIPCRCSSFSSCTSLRLNKFRNLLRLEWAPVYHGKGWGKFKRHYRDFCTGADTRSKTSRAQRIYTHIKDALGFESRLELSLAKITTDFEINSLRRGL